MNLSKAEENSFSLTELKSKPKSVEKNDESVSESQNLGYNPLYYCRTCACKDTFFVPIFKGEGLDHQLNQKIEKYLPIQITKNDELPLQLCYNCASTIIAWDNLIVGCVEAEKKLVSLKNRPEQYPLAEPIINEGNEESFRGVSDKIDSDEEPLITKKLAALSSSKKRKVAKKNEVQTKTEEKSEMESFKNDSERENGTENPGIVPEPFAADEDSGSDWSPDSIRTYPKTDVSTRAKDKKVFQCNICNKVLNRRFNFERHLLVHSGETLTCHACGKQYRGQSVLDRHIKVIHQQMRVPALNCDYCGKGFSSRQSLEDHFRTHTGERPFICEICGKDFRARPNLIAHKKIHTGKLPFSCNLCDYKCRLKGTFIDHCQRHEGKRTCLCSVCGKGFVNNYDLSKHKKTHSKDRLFSCSSCNLSFVMKRYLKVHMKTHLQKNDPAKASIAF